MTPVRWLEDNWGRPFTGAWIETWTRCRDEVEPDVAPSRGRGLKLLVLCILMLVCRRPFTGAWIETGGHTYLGSVRLSPLHGGVD